jgi:probable rRNA maturation factor
LKNLRIYSKNKLIEKKKIHFLIKSLSEPLRFKLTSLEINFVKADEILLINRKYLKHNYYTDIITFNYSEEKYLIDGEIFISITDAFENANIYKVAAKEEIFRLVIHGILHLLGYDDLKKKDKNIMKRLENRLLNSNKFILL